ncbi:hypothetical protein GBA52_015513 [Prunus armeniaca]|nr:hypothetical protein GBA52_015513 [Prunus armeniaca]
MAPSLAIFTLPHYLCSATNNYCKACNFLKQSHFLNLYYKVAAAAASTVAVFAGPSGFARRLLHHKPPSRFSISSCLQWGIIEELKAYKKPDNSILLCRPEEHGLRMRVGAERLLMPAPTVEQFVEAVKVTVLENRRWGGLELINLVVENEIHRAVRGGAGSVKAIGNYAAVISTYHLFT